ncbi:hypothetical protein [uncultured Tateyamaria sp.]|uniref:hypothetical protein n=1 Tax=uncultured Tateyamaria sp. TaxID=455651 RepID=UPI00260DCD85|nr:hypothetical protein [uncultured Tateyamaria sp.]
MRDALPLDLPVPEMIDILQREVAKPGKNKASVAREIGMPRPSLSLLLRGKYPAKLDKVHQKYANTVLRLFAGKVYCPHQKQGISETLCKTLHAAPVTTSCPDRFAQHMACKRCQNNPQNQNNQPDMGADKEET